MTTIAQNLENCWGCIQQVRNPVKRNSLIGQFKQIALTNARSVTADLFSTKRHHLAYQDGSILTRNQGIRNPINAYVRGGVNHD